MLYIDGERCGSNTITTKPSNFASSAKQCWLGRSPYEADAYMTNTMMDNLRIYNKALTATQVKELYNSRPTSTTIATGIEEVHVNTCPLNETNHNLFNPSGQRLISHQKGINIINGQKIMVR